MFIKLLILFTLAPAVELYVMFEVGALIGIEWTLLLILLTGVAGAYLARTQGFELLRQTRAELDQGRLPARELLQGALVLAGGILLLTPGFCTDIFGFSLLVPLTRNFWVQVLQQWLVQMNERGRIHIHRL